nr:DUF2145 domain-containing protein [Massilia sp. TS11]
MAALLVCAGAQASTAPFCDRSKDISAREQDRVLRFTAAVKDELRQAGADLALIARSGTDLSRFGLLYSHAGIALRDPADGSWAVRQLYYACDEARPRLFDQGLAGFALGADQPGSAHISLVFLPGAAGSALAEAASDKARALSALASDYSANAYAFATRYQNCNQWLIELMALAWGGIAAGPDLRERAQAWLRAHDYQPDTVRIPAHWVAFAAQFVPLVHVQDHPVEDLQALRLRISLPTAIEAFARQQVAQARRVELCHTTEHIVIRHGWQPLDAACRPQPGDTVLALNAPDRP